MKFIQKICFSGETEEALEEYKKAFGCTIRSLLHYSDAVKNGWERPDEEKESLVYHSEIIGFDTAEEVEKAFSVLIDGGEVIRPLERPPYMLIIGTVKDRFGVKWELMCDF